jgi:diguanylate cyclase (GGDEF)-like protein
VFCDKDRQIVKAVLIEHHLVCEGSEVDIHVDDIDLIRQVVATSASSNGVTSMCNPMESDGRLLGAFCCAGSRTPQGPQECRFAHFLAEYLAGTFDRLLRSATLLRQTKALSNALGERERAMAAASWLSEQMSHLAHHDALTKLPNRALLNDRLGRAMKVADRNGTRVAVMFVDLDRFKYVNDSMGHGVGDQVLHCVSDRLAASVRSSDTVSRHGGDEFVILCAELDRAEDAGISAAKIIAAIEPIMPTGGHDLYLTCSVGISVYPDDGGDGAGLIKSADTAMYAAKAAGGNRYRYFKPAMNDRVVERQFMEEGLRRALERQEFVMHYQPKVDLQSGGVIGAEALIRWRHPERGLISPGQFISVAEQCGLIVPMGQWVLGEVCRQARTWKDVGLPRLAISVNLSATELKSTTFLDDVRRMVTDASLEAADLELEITEGVLMDNSEVNIDILEAVRAMGVKIAIDDFGTGYSSLSYLARLPIDTLKIDQSFVHQLRRVRSAIPDRAALVMSAMIRMGASLNHRVVAEGVETREQVDFLREQHCSVGQGYLFSRALQANEFAAAVGTGYARYVH